MAAKNVNYRDHHFGPPNLDEMREMHRALNSMARLIFGLGRVALPGLKMLEANFIQDVFAYIHTDRDFANNAIDTLTASENSDDRYLASNMLHEYHDGLISSGAVEDPGAEAQRWSTLIERERGNMFEDGICQQFYHIEFLAGVSSVNDRELRPFANALSQVRDALFLLREPGTPDARG